MPTLSSYLYFTLLSARDYLYISAYLVLLLLEIPVPSYLLYKS